MELCIAFCFERGAFIGIVTFGKSYFQPFDAESAGVQYGPGGLSTFGDKPEVKSLEGSNSAGDGEDRGFDAPLLDYLMNADKYKDQAAACCSTVLVRGSSVDGIFIKNETLINGRPAFINEDGGNIFLKFYPQAPDSDLKATLSYLSHTLFKCLT